MFGLLERALRRRAPAAEASVPAAPRVTLRSGGPVPAVKRGNTAAEQSLSEPEALLRRIEWTVVKRLDGLLQGDFRTLFRGHGFDLADLREYQPADDVRFIDWNVTARLQAPYVRQHQEDREVAVWMLMDLSGSVDFGSGLVSKRRVATRFCAVMARLLSARGNRIGARLLTDGQHPVSVIEPGNGRRHLLHLIDRVGRARPTPGDPVETDLSKLLNDARRNIRRRSAVFIVSDFVSRPGWEQALGSLAQVHDVVAIRLFDPLEQALPDLGLMAMRDAETDELIWLDSGDAQFRARFKALSDEHEQQLRTSLARAGVDCVELSTEEDLGDALARFIQMRKRQLQRGAGRAPAQERFGAPP
ncbi:MAG: hypothetical protein RL322_1339 [Pseudomonadota bacterium]|jgi:uncharacterized protein (DUF58 family)